MKRIKIYKLNLIQRMLIKLKIIKDPRYNGKKYVIGIDEQFLHGKSYGALCVMKGNSIVKIFNYKGKIGKIKVYLCILYYVIFYNTVIIKEY